jgi:hypothetical protein
MEKKVYVILEESVSYDDATAYVSGVYSTMEGAKSGLRRAIEVSCAGIKDDIEDNLEEEDLEEYDSFDEYWDEWVENRYDSECLWSYSAEDSQSITIQIVERMLDE